MNIYFQKCRVRLDRASIGKQILSPALQFGGPKILKGLTDEQLSEKITYTFVIRVLKERNRANAMERYFN